jgi:hypothetical protein
MTTRQGLSGADPVRWGPVGSLLESGRRRAGVDERDRLESG